MKLIKINTDHYVVVDDSEIKEDCWALHMGPLGEREIVTANGQCKLDKKITHSTQPLEINNLYRKYDFINIKSISLQEVKELIGEVDVEKKAEYHYEMMYLMEKNDNIKPYVVRDYVIAYNQALEDNKEKKYTEEDLRKAIEMAQETVLTDLRSEDREHKYDKYEILQSIQPKTEWEVEMVDGKLKLK